MAISQVDWRPKDKRDKMIFTIHFYHRVANEEGYHEIEATSAAEAKYIFTHTSRSWEEDCDVLNVLIPAYVGETGTDFIVNKGKK